MINYTCSGTDATGKEWEVTGILQGTNPIDHDVVNQLGSAVFNQLTQGKARFGHPGEGCKGPYSIKLVTLVTT